eukprot:46764-Rhodomonas_salina.2
MHTCTHTHVDPDTLPRYWCVQGARSLALDPAVVAWRAMEGRCPRCAARDTRVCSSLRCVGTASDTRAHTREQQVSAKMEALNERITSLEKAQARYAQGHMGLFGGHNGANGTHTKVRPPLSNAELQCGLECECGKAKTIRANAEFGVEKKGGLDADRVLSLFVRCTRAVAGCLLSPPTLHPFHESLERQRTWELTCLSLPLSLARSLARSLPLSLSSSPSPSLPLSQSLCVQDPAVSGWLSFLNPPPGHSAKGGSPPGSNGH